MQENVVLLKNINKFYKGDRRPGGYLEEVDQGLLLFLTKLIYVKLDFKKQFTACF